MAAFTILVLDNAYPSSIASTLDILEAASAVARSLSQPRPRWSVVSINGGAQVLSNGFSVSTVKLNKRSAPVDSLWIVPGLGVDGVSKIQSRLAQSDAVKMAGAISRHLDAGGSVAASCSAVFLLQSAGILRNRLVTTSWWLAPLLQQLEPHCEVNSDRMLCVDGPVITAGAAFAQVDLVLHLLRLKYDSSIADAVSKYLLIDGRQAQAPYIVPEVFAAGDKLVGDVARLVEDLLPDVPSVGELASRFCISDKTLNRHIRKATGRSTLSLIQSVRLRCARKLLETSRLSVEKVAEAVGYQDASALRRMMIKVGGANPSRFRLFRELRS